MYTLKNAHGIELQVLDYGGIIVSLRVPDRTGRLDDVVLGFDSLADYERGSPYFGALIGRYGNRIARGRFTLDGRTYTLATNNGLNHLHGGVRGFDKVVWAAAPFEHGDSVGLVLNYTSRDDLVNNIPSEVAPVFGRKIDTVRLVVGGDDDAADVPDRVLAQVLLIHAQHFGR